MNISSDINKIQPISIQVWNCDEICFDANGKWHKVICTYRLLPGEKNWKVQIVDQLPFLFTLIVFTSDGGKCFILTILFHQPKEYFQYLHFNMPLELIVHHKPYRYMDRDRFLKSTTQFYTIWGTSTIYNQIIFFGRYDSHYNEITLGYM